MNAVMPTTAHPTTLQHVRLWPKASQRRVTWLELFFDVIFVAAVAQIGIPLSQDYSLPGLARYVFMFVLIWWAWLGHTTYCTRFQADDAIERLLTFLQFFAVAIMAANAKAGLGSEDSAGFGAAYAVMRGVLVVQYVRARHIASARRLATYFASGFGIAATLWLAAALVPMPYRFALWGLALLIDFATPWLAAKHAHHVPADAAHFPERFGLFTLILLGESVAAVMHGIEQQSTWYPSAVAAAFTSLGILCAFWWGYFEFTKAAEERHIRTPREQSMLTLWMYSHPFFYLAIATLGIGLEHVITRGNPVGLHREELALVLGSFAGACISLTLIGKSRPRAAK